VTVMMTIKVIMVMTPIATPIAAVPIAATPPLAAPCAHSGLPASRGHRHEMVAATGRGRHYRCRQRQRSKATQEKYKFCIH
jgi:hypothetical protein